VKKYAVVLFNLGGPDSKESIRPFLMNFFMDKNIIRLPKIFRFLIATMIANRRSKNEAGTSYGLLGDKSPLLQNSRAQAAALEQVLNRRGIGNFKTFVCMRYWHPMAEEVVRDVRNWYADDVILLPLYPQFSTTTTWSSLGEWDDACKKFGLSAPTATICCYPFNDGFIKASADNIRVVYNQALKDGYKNPRILFSAHGLPESVITDGDPYQWQCEQSAEKIVRALNIPDLDWRICYQSRVGPKKWIGPATDDQIREVALEKKPLIIYPHAFTQEHVETLVELDIEYKHLADEVGLKGYYRVPTVSVQNAFIEGLADLVKERVHKEGVYTGTKAEGGRQICPENFRRCCMRARDVGV
jgi:ferrochelatase